MFVRKKKDGIRPIPYGTLRWKLYHLWLWIKGWRIVHRGDLVDVGIGIACPDDESLRKVFAVEKCLHEMGIHFDTGFGCGQRDWEMDYSLSGPIEIYFKKIKKRGAISHLRYILACKKRRHSK